MINASYPFHVLQLCSLVKKKKKKNVEEGNLIARKFSDFEGNLVSLREKLKKYIREICHPGGKSWSDCREINIFPGLVVLNHVPASLLICHVYLPPQRGCYNVAKPLRGVRFPHAALAPLCHHCPCV